MILAFLRRHPLTVIVLAQLCGTSLWFSINGVWWSMAPNLGLSDADLGYLTLAVQLGFIVGTLTMAATGLADRFHASVIFAVACLCGALVNGAFLLVAAQPPFDLLLRFLTGLCLAGIYPLGMKLIISWVPRHAGAALSWLVGMLTLGTALPHLMQGMTLGMPWQWPLLGASVLALLGGVLVLLLGDGPHLPKAGGKIPLRQGLSGLKIPRFRAVAGGYFGHCWELYAFWMLVPLLVGREIGRLDAADAWIPWLAFAVIALGFAGCVGGGVISRYRGSEWVARRALAMSGALCLAYPFLTWAPAGLLLILLALWGVAVIADSPQFSALAAANAPRELVGSSLAVMNAIGFALTLPAIWLTSLLWELQGAWVILWLLPGPVLGLWAMRGLKMG
ncbi:MFS transporter [Ectothiorhodospira lacustris]|uniref:MFS transporter n=1 Tax=Ectothiorhodospira lacustris TaxID=2899127 RepID=UPI001EE83555|nr:MFS transporter [Ectothiorhodospira lacustris]MCG5501095.1 MFS transporter [Ectothiorhodospira lacustris]MCG5511198.1 MFS transporter [Ectothiorhodospira lacustris]MCG5522862.1 MFS transporter [Ectothiorhodospira lacustris]